MDNFLSLCKHQISSELYSVITVITRNSDRHRSVGSINYFEIQLHLIHILGISIWKKERGARQADYFIFLLSEYKLEFRRLDNELQISTTKGSEMWLRKREWRQHVTEKLLR